MMKHLKTVSIFGHPNGNQVISIKLLPIIIICRYSIQYINKKLEDHACPFQEKGRMYEH